jgi:hypothetical protein
VAKAEARKKATEPGGVSKPPPDPSADPKGALERMRELTRKIVRVPKSELPTDKPATRKPRHD